MDTHIIVIELKYGKHDSLTQVPKRFSLLTGLHVAKLLESEVTKLMCRNANDNIITGTKLKFCTTENYRKRGG